MKKYRFFVLLLITVFALAFAPVWACEGPGCVDRDASGYINAGGNQWQNDSYWRDGNTNFVSHNLNLNQYDWIRGEGTNGFTADASVGLAQGREFDNTIELGAGGKYTRFWGSVVQSEFKEATLTENCNTVNATGGQHFNATALTDQANSGDHRFMTGNIYVGAGADVSLIGGKHGTGAEFNQSGVVGYKQVDKSGNWQIGSVGINTNLNIPTQTAPPQD